MSVPLNHAQLQARLDAVRQGHVFGFYPRLAPAAQRQLDAQVASIDWELVGRLVDTVVKHPQPFTLPADVQPAPYYENQPTDPLRQAKYRQAFSRGEELLRQGRIAAFVVAGGQGTRLGWDGPKGTFPATPVQHKSLFQSFAEFLLALGQRYGRDIPFYIMTSPTNDAPTRACWQEHDHFGMKPENVMFFSQDQLPAVSFDGQVLLAAPDSMALSPNGHGGSLLALHKSGALADMARRGITQISYFQVDNPIVRCIDPLFIGLHDLDDADMSSKMLPKAFGKEKLGNFAIIEGRLSVIEYSDLPDELAEQRLANGDLRFRSGSIALHALRRTFVERINEKGFQLPYHRAEKKIPHVDISTGQQVEPTKVNGVKLETFVFDALPLTRTSIIYETDRGDEFGPIKQPTGVDSVVSSHAVTTARNAAWLEAAGIQVPRKPDGTPDCTIEIAWSCALYAPDLRGKQHLVPAIKPGDRVYVA